MQRKRFMELQKQRDVRAADLGLDPTLIASRAALSDLAHDWEAHASELMLWQKELLAELTHNLKCKALEILRLRYHGNNWMIR